MRGWMTGLLILALLGIAAAAGAEERSIAVVETYVRGVDNPSGGEYSRAIGRALADSGRFAVISRDEVARRIRAVLIVPVGRLQADRMTRIEDLIRQGDQLVYTDPVAAIEVLNKARAELDSIAQGVAANEALRKEFLKTTMLLARSHLDSGNEAKATDVLREVVRVFGDGLEVTEREYHPQLVKLYKKTLAAMNEERVGAVYVDTLPRGCQALLDGRVLPGETPREYKGIYEGVHHLQVRCGVRESMIRKILVKRDRLPLTVDVEFEHALTVEGDRVGLVFDSDAAAEALGVEFAAKLGNLLGVDEVVVQGIAGAAGKTSLEARRVDVKSATEVGTGLASARSDAMSGGAVKTVTQGILAGRTAAPVAARGGRVQWYENYWGWSLIGLGLVGVGIGGWQTSVYLDQKSIVERAYPTTSKDDILSEYEAKKNAADKANKARIGMIASYAAGGALIVGGAVLMVLTDRVFPAKSASRDDGPRFVLAPQPYVGGGGVAAALRW